MFSLTSSTGGFIFYHGVLICKKLCSNDVCLKPPTHLTCSMSIGHHFSQFQHDCIDEMSLCKHHNCTITYQIVSWEELIAFGRCP